MNRKYLPFVGIDDFAFCKGHTYGTLICDLQSKFPLAILSDRLPETITNWLLQYPYIEVVSRDGFTSFRQGISNANTQITQIYDRWHFIRNAKKQLDSFLSTLVPATITWSDSDPSVVEIPLTCAEQLTKNRQNKKWELIREIQQAYKNGKNISRLSREYKLDRRTISKYITMNEPPVTYRKRNRPSDSYREQILNLEQEGNTLKEIYQTIKKQGYMGTYSAVRTIVERARKERKYGILSKPQMHVSRKKLGAWIWKLKIELNKDETNLLNQCFELYPSVKSLYTTIQTYRVAIEMKDLETFASWLREQLSSKKNPFYNYAFRLRSDIQAVKNSFLSPYSNGLLEGQINRLKTIKRMTYGRAGLKILEKRVLYRL
ncbi:transposase [Schinkia azotoformans]|uniref:transposase n=1 Tax=Schinkia azotoformans TaxID=1454 RepID=UPI002DB6D26A|nr:transposase [Schinkia azotoformans]MEC1723077.1 transposase [Schinkia azotoformans]MED4414729.1 transposase [Schinkia azotoformans]